MEKEEEKANGVQSESNVSADGPTQVENGTTGDKEPEIETFPMTVKTCGEPKVSIPLQVSLIDNIQDIRQFLFESLDTCYITSYHLYYQGTKLNDYIELGSVQGMKPNATLEMVEGLYDERGIRLHVRRLREILTPPPTSVSPSLFSKISRQEESDKDKPKGEDKKSVSVKDEAIESLQNPPSLVAYYPEQHTLPIQCVKSITFSGWNPPPGYRKLIGDLVYLEIVTLENRTFHVTGSNTGFFVNNTNGGVFNPTPSENSYKSHSLAGLLNKCSPLFKKNFTALLNTNFQEHPFEVLPIPFPVVPWVNKREVHQFDLNRAEDSILLTSETDMRGQLRDWNEEYQSCKELPSETIQDRILRDRALVKVNCDFVEAATKGACAIIEKSIPPINPLEPEKAHMYIYNNIFFSYSLDGREFYKDCGGDRAAYVSVNNDLKGIKAFNRADIKGLHTLCTAIIDYRGKRLCAQSIIPGILQREQTSTVVYGSIDNGKKISSDPTFHELICKVGKDLHIKEHTILDEEGKEFKICSALESKGILGTDGRRYVLDLIRTTPRDMNYTGKNHLLTTLRPELIQAFCEYLLEVNKKQTESEQSKKEGEQTKTEGEQTKIEGGEGKQEVKEAETKDKSGKEEIEDQKLGEAEIKAATDESLEAAQEMKKYAFNPNVFCDYKLGNSKEIEEDEEMVKKAAKFLTEKIIPIMIEEFSYLINVPVDGQTLTSVMHARGINMRYLGMVTNLAQQAKVSIIQELALREMITRAAKHIIRNILVDVEDYNLAPLLSHFLNCLLGDAVEPPKAENKENVKRGSAAHKKKKKVAKSSGTKTAFSLSTAKLWSQITAEVKERFQFELPARNSIGSIVSCVPTLRSICQKVGIQIEAKDYDFTLPEPFKPEDILQLFPVIKHTNPETGDGKNLLEAGKAFLAQARLDIAYELLVEALSIFHQVYGPMHRDTANCYGNLAMVLYNAKDITQALDHQQRAAIINERVLGLDHHDTTHSYGNLALFCHNMGKTNLALQYIKRALFLGRTVCGPNHPDTATSFMNIAMMLQDLSKHRQAIEYLFQSLSAYDAILGPNSPQSAQIYHAIAIAYSQLEQFKDALNYEKKNFAILHATVGDSDIRAIESNIWLRQFTQKAVAMQIETQKAQRDIQAQLSATKMEQLKNIQLTGKASPVVDNGPKSAPATLPNIGNRPLTELLAYINDKPITSGSSFKQRNQKNFASPIISTPIETIADSPAKKAKKKKGKKKEEES